MAEITKFEPRRRKPAKCPICGRPPVPALTPFCSKRCADVDLNRWLSGVYRVETNEAPADQAGDRGGARSVGPGGAGGGGRSDEDDAEG